LITSRTRREDFGIERNQSFKGDHGNAQFSLCCTSTAMPDDDSQDRHPAFLFFCGLRIAQLSTLAATRPRSSYNVIYPEEAILARGN
jgi:hypothetical protein